MVEAGADIIDIGGESTRPFSEAITGGRRNTAGCTGDRSNGTENHGSPFPLIPPKQSVAEKAKKAGASIINDIGALRVDPGIADVAAQYNVPLILMHMQGTPRNMQVWNSIITISCKISRHS